MGAWELQLWIAKAQVDNAIEAKQRKRQGLTYSQAFEQVQSDHRSVMRRKGK